MVLAVTEDHVLRNRMPTSGDVFGSRDGGASWFSVHERLAPVNTVRVA